MEIIETPINNFEKKLVYKSNKYPQCSCDKCFKLFFNAIFVASRASGKTYCMSRIIKHYEDNDIRDEKGNKYQVRTIVISPTYEQNSVFQALKSIDEDNDVYNEYSDTIIDGIIEDIDSKTEAVKYYNKYQEVFKKFMKLNDNELHKLNDEELSMLAENNFENNLEKPPMYVNFIILDDLLGGKGFSSSKRSKLMNYFIKNRHHGVCFMIAVQSMRGVPREIRLNTNVFFLGKFANSKIICEDCYEEISNVMKLEDFMKLYEKSIEDKYGALLVDLTGDNKRFLKNLDGELSINNIT